MTETVFDRSHFDVVLAEFVEDNPLACQGILSVARVVFTSDVPTLAVTLREDPPLLKVNPAFLATHIRTEDDLRALLLHEFLHVLLGHTRLFTRMDEATNFALDAVINHIVQRELGLVAGDFFRRFYTPKSDTCPFWLLRPEAPGDIRPGRESLVTPIHRLRKGLLEGTVLADDVLDALASLDLLIPSGLPLIGSHGTDPEVHPANRARLDRLFKELDGDGIFRRPLDHGVGAAPYVGEWSAKDPVWQWRIQTARLLRSLLVPDPRSRPVSDGLLSYALPVAHAGDRRAALRALWNPLLPEFEWQAERVRPGGLTNVYLDVSGSMDAELTLLTGLLWRLRSWIRTPFQAFSNGVAPAKFVDGKLVTQTTGGTCFNDVLTHIIDHRPGKSLVITDGYIENPDTSLLKRLRSLGEEIHVLVSAAGTTGPFDRHSIPRTCLPVLPAHPSR